MAEKKLTRKELLKEPDEFLTITGRVIRYTREHPRPVTVGCALVVIVVLAGRSFYYHQKNREVRSHELFDQVSREYEVAVQSPQQPTPQKLDKLLAEFDSLAREYNLLSRRRNGVALQWARPIQEARLQGSAGALTPACSPRTS